MLPSSSAYDALQSAYRIKGSVYCKLPFGKAFTKGQDEFFLSEDPLPVRGSINVPTPTSVSRTLLPFACSSNRREMTPCERIQISSNPCSASFNCAFEVSTCPAIYFFINPGKPTSSIVPGTFPLPPWAPQWIHVS